MESENKHSGDIYTVLGWIESNRKQLISAVVVIILIGVAISYFNWRKAEGEIAAGQALSSVYLGGAGTNVTAAALLKVAGEHGGTLAAERALIAAASQQFVDGKTEEAKASYQKLINDYPESALLGQAKYGLAACLDAQGKAADAIVAYREVADRFAEENVKGPAKLALGRLYEADGKLEQARDAYMEIARDPRRALDSEAITRLTDLIQKHPELRPKSPEPAVSRTVATPAPAAK